MPADRSLSDRIPLPTRLSEDLRGRLRAREFPPGGQLPSEAELGREYGVSRVTVRQALKALESQGLVVTRHGRGTFVVEGETIHAGIQELRSITDTISHQGREPDVRFRTVDIRSCTEGEGGALSLKPGAPLLAVSRAIRADNEVVAYSYDHIPVDLLPKEFEPSHVKGSLFRFLEQVAGVVATRAVAEVHAIYSAEIGWGEDPGAHLYLLLDQVHFDLRGRAIMLSKTYFLEGRFNFVVIRN